MTDSTDDEKNVKTAKETPVVPPRRPWQTPRVILASIAEAENQCNGTSDGPSAFS
ncbi:MAG TPA: hypothetical protein VM782_13285 [Stellaceae bacterium]|nr:hypothetical protein [Stellaceae bacterium]